MEIEEAIAKNLRIHYYLMDNPRFWYDSALREASMICCVIASDLKAIGKVRDLRMMLGKK